MFMILDTDKVNLTEEQKEVEVECPLCSFVQLINREDIEHLLSCPECNTLFVVKNKNRR